MKKKLRIGILLDNYNIPAWSYAMLENIKASSSGEIVLIVKNKQDAFSKGSLFKRIISHRKRLLYLIFTKIETALFKTTPNAFELKDIRNILSINTVEVNPIKTKFRDEINDIDLKEIKDHNIDILIKMGFRILSGDVLKAAKFGIWSYHHGDNKVNRGGPAGFWEVLEKWPETGAILQILTEDLNNGVLLQKSYSVTDNISTTRNKNNYYWNALSFLPSKIEELYNLGEDVFFRRIEELNSSPQFYSNRLYTAPTNKEMFVLGPKLALKYIFEKINALFYIQQWILLFRLSTTNTLSTSFYKFKKILPPKDRFWADPFILRKNGNYYIFIEELMYATNKGHISVIVMDDKGNYTEPTKVLEKDYHLSYPFLIEENGELYMIPESIENRTIELYKCTNFPSTWELEKVLINNIAAADSTIIFKDGKYWLFANVIRNEGASLDELFLFYSDTLISEYWTPHPQNPIISDVKQSRPAGNFFTYKDKLYRPSQNCSKRYGYGMKINEVMELTETNYEERVVDSIFPNWDKSLLATHTLNSVNNLTVIDAVMKRRK